MLKKVGPSTKLVAKILFVCFLVVRSVFADSPDASAIEFSIPKQAAEQSLLAFASQSNVTLLFPLAMVEGKVTNELVGKHKIVAGLELMLQGTGLEAKFDSSGQVYITLVTSTPSPVSVISKTVVPDDTVQIGREIETILVKGIRGSLSRSLNEKRFASAITDVISAEDIGQLPDTNVAESLQRVTGIQMARDPQGEGTQIQIRGLSENNIQINGQTVAGSSGDRIINFQDLPSELFSLIEVIITSSADQIEGALGGTINLSTLRPLNADRDALISATSQVKYAEIAEQTEPELNVFWLKNWRDTQWGDVGLTLSVAHRQVNLLAETFDQSYLYRDGSYQPSAGDGSSIRTNLFHPVSNASVFTFDNAVDVNGDGLSNTNDIWYMPNRYNIEAISKKETRDSLHAALQWQPNNGMNLYLDATLTDVERINSGSRFSITTNRSQAMPLISDNNRYALLDSVDGLGDIYLMTSGTISNANIRMGASPSIDQINRQSNTFTLGGDWQINDRLALAFEASISRGTSKTVQQGAITMGIDANGDNRFSLSDWAQAFAFDATQGRTHRIQFFESPFVAESFGVDQAANELTIIDPTNIDYARFSYFQFNRVAQDNVNKADAARADFSYNKTGLFNEVKLGLRWSERSFNRRFFEGRSQFVQDQTPGLAQADQDLIEQISIQGISVNPMAETDMTTQMASSLLRTCITPGGNASFLEDEVTNLPRVWSASLGCSILELTDAFGLLDIRALNLDGSGIYEDFGEGYFVQEETLALYALSNFEWHKGNIYTTGNVGLRYVDSRTTSSGFAGSGVNREFVRFPGAYQAVLPSFTANIRLPNSRQLRLGLSRTLGKPALSLITPSVDIDRINPVDGFSGTATKGNPDLAPVFSNNLDIAFDWYFADQSLFSLAFFHKNIDSTIALDESNPQPLQIGEELFLVTTPNNLQGTKLDGLEINIQHAFVNLPGWFSHTGAGFNYTYTKESSNITDGEGENVGRTGLSSNSFNLAGFYDDGKVALRIAYNWRNQFVVDPFWDVSLGNSLPIIEAARGQLDVNASYQWAENLRVQLSFINLNQSETERFLKRNEMLAFLANPGIRAKVGVTVRY